MVEEIHKIMHKLMAEDNEEINADKKEDDDEEHNEQKDNSFISGNLKNNSISHDLSFLNISPIKLIENTSRIMNKNRELLSFPADFHSQPQLQQSPFHNLLPNISNINNNDFSFANVSENDSSHQFQNS